jgi:hypothetical protein
MDGLRPFVLDLEIAAMGISADGDIAVMMGPIGIGCGAGKALDNGTGRILAERDDVAVMKSPCLAAGIRNMQNLDRRGQLHAVVNSQHDTVGHECEVQCRKRIVDFGRGERAVQPVSIGGDGFRHAQQAHALGQAARIRSLQHTVDEDEAGEGAGNSRCYRRCLVIRRCRDCRRKFARGDRMKVRIFPALDPRRRQLLASETCERFRAHVP